MPGPDASAASTPASAADQPVSLVVRRDGPLVDAQVVAVASCTCAGRFRIESRSGSANNSVNTSSFGRIDKPGGEGVPTNVEPGVLSGGAGKDI